MVGSYVSTKWFRHSCWGSADDMARRDEGAYLDGQGCLANTAVAQHHQLVQRHFARHGDGCSNADSRRAWSGLVRVEAEAEAEAGNSGELGGCSGQGKGERKEHKQSKAEGVEVGVELLVVQEAAAAWPVQPLELGRVQRGQGVGVGGGGELAVVDPSDSVYQQPVAWAWDGKGRLWADDSGRDG